MNLTDKLSTELPFPGFYGSSYSAALDSEAEHYVEHIAECQQAEDGIPKELRLTEDEYADILLDVTDYSVAELTIAKAYVETFDSVASERLGFKLGLGFEEMTSPREYNFTTDRVFASISYGRALRLAALSRRDGHSRLRAEIGNRFTSYDGFSSSYSNELAVWLDKSLKSWDHNEIGTLLRAVLDGDTLREITDDMLDTYDAWELSVNWIKFEAKVQECRDEKLKALDPGYVAPAPRCQHTSDMFKS